MRNSSDYYHSLNIFHNSKDAGHIGSVKGSEYEVELNSSSHDLVEAWGEVLSRMPTDLYTALREAMPQ